MRYLFQRFSKKAGLSPGTLVHVGDAVAGPVRITVIDYDASGRVEERTATSVEECFPYRDRSSVTWINVDGVHDVEVLRALGDHFNLHPLMLEDIAHTEQRPKLEEFEDHIYIVLRMLYVDIGVQEQTDASAEDGENALAVESEQISVVVGQNVVLTFQEKPGDVFDPVRQRIRNGRGRIRREGADFLAYALMDVVVDQYFVVLERFGDHMEDLEADLMGDPSRDTLAEIRTTKRAMIQVRRSVWPLRDVLNVLLRGDSKRFKKNTLIYLRDVYDHTVQVVDIVETLRELVGGMLDIYLSNVSNRMNEIMKVLTIMATIFIPLTFIAGVYGMNFQHMPELAWRYGYWAVLGVMLGVGGALLVYFKRKGWL